MTGHEYFQNCSYCGLAQSAVVSINQKWSKEGPVIKDRVLSKKGSSMCVGSENWPMWFSPTVELLLLKLKKLMLVLIHDTLQLLQIGAA